MSLIIRGMEMPKSCYECQIRRRDGMDIVCPVAHERFSVADANIPRYRLDNCPLIPVPPHGRLGDLDELHEAALMQVSLSFTSKTKKQAAMAVANVISNTPTIIPASEERN